MPIYEYRCLECGKISETFLQKPDSRSARCPMCGSHKLDKLLSTAYTLKSGTSMPGTTCCGRTERCQTPPCSSGDPCRRDKR